MLINLDSLDLLAAERRLVERALADHGSIIEAAPALGITRHALKRRIIKHGIQWPRSSRVALVALPESAAPE